MYGTYATGVDRTLFWLSMRLELHINPSTSSTTMNSFRVSMYESSAKTVSLSASKRGKLHVNIIHAHFQRSLPIKAKCYAIND